jgi:hypothetical protein
VIYIQEGKATRSNRERVINREDIINWARHIGSFTYFVYIGHGGKRQPQPWLCSCIEVSRVSLIVNAGFLHVYRVGIANGALDISTTLTRAVYCVCQC